MANAILSYINHVDGAVISASSQTGDLTPDNLRDPIIGKRYRTTGLTAMLDFDFGADKTSTVLVLRSPRDTDLASGTVQHFLDADGGSVGNGAAYDSGSVSLAMSDGYGYHVHYTPGGVTARYWRVAFNLSGVDFVDFGRAWAGQGIVIPINIAYGWEQTPAPLSTVQRSPVSGAAFPDQRDLQWQQTFAIENMQANQKNELRELLRTVTIGRQFLSIIDPAPTNDEAGKLTVIGRFSQAQTIRQPTFQLYSTRQMQIVEDN